MALFLVEFHSVDASGRVSATAAPNRPFRNELVLFQHYFGGLDDGFDGVANLELHFVCAALCDNAFNQVVSNPYNHVGHNAAQLNFFNSSSEFIAGRQCHKRNVAWGAGLRQLESRSCVSGVPEVRGVLNSVFFLFRLTRKAETVLHNSSLLGRP